MSLPREIRLKPQLAVQSQVMHCGLMRLLPLVQRSSSSSSSSSCTLVHSGVHVEKLLLFDSEGLRVTDV
ncbi:hypothetical protein EYF80_035002 [Liparis tanakae]|uniref:Uncharacterized protein n=1 Tax=Liparis tanakae TaxID=230148 RepID=A0A4Z2GMQ2_9TELE|nr:hypothetical protein EYF80_035002 [Liparis tanakae]